MSLFFLDRLSGSEGLASKPRIWGKLPAYGDYVHWQVSVEEARAWQKWVGETWSQREATPPIHTAMRDEASREHWVKLDISAQPAAQEVLPVAFVIPPGGLSFNPDHYVQGVMMDSRDKVGRECPLIIYQMLTPNWAQRFWQFAEKSEALHQLFWLSRLAARSGNDMSIGKLAGAVEKVCAQYKPHWQQKLGATPKSPDLAVLNEVLKRFGGASEEKLSKLRGVRHLPWSDWPSRVLRTDEPVPAYWVQDINGRYVTASDALSRLWRGI